MSTDPNAPLSTRAQTRHGRSLARQARRYALAFVAVFAVLGILGGVGAIVTLSQGPRLTRVQADPATAIEASGSRVILTANQALEDVTAEQVHVEPAVAFTVDASGRGIGIRFTAPLDDDTAYDITVSDVRAAGGGPAATLRTTVTTPPAVIYLMQRSDTGDTIFRSDLSGQATAVFSHPRIDDFRPTSQGLAIAVEENGTSQIILTDREGRNERRLTLPGTGYVTRLDASDRGDFLGYVYSDKNLSATSGRASVLFFQSVRDPAAAPIPVAVAGAQPGIVTWQFVPDTSAAAFITFAGELFVVDPLAGGAPAPFGNGVALDGISRGEPTAVVQRGRELSSLDLVSGAEKPLAAPVSPGITRKAVPLPGGEMIWEFTQYDAKGIPTTQTLVRSGTGDPRVISTIPEGDALLQSCVSPSGRYLALVVAPHIANNPYDQRSQPVPKTVYTHIVDAQTGAEKQVLDGFGISWCHSGPWR